MPPEERKDSLSLPPDFISDLPDNVINGILLCLPCKEAVKTSILSKKWRNHWCRLTELTLDDSCWSAEEDLRDPTVKFSKIIYQLITLHKGPITKFTLDISKFRSPLEIDFFIYFLSRKGIEHLVLYPPQYKLFKLPSSLFLCSQLRHLDLNDCLIRSSPFFKGFEKLISLELFGVVISSELLNSLVSNCPLLEQLVLVNIEDATEIEINAPMLRSFDFKGITSSICLRSVPLLLKVSLTGFDMMTECVDFAKVFKSCSALEHLLINFHNFELTAEEGFEAPKRLPVYLNSVKRFDITSISLMESSHQFPYALCLIRSFPYLEYLEIEVYSEKDDRRILESLELEHFSDVTFTYLKEVKLKCYAGSTREMQLIKLFLAKSPALERMLIDRRSGLLDTRLNLFDEVSNFLRASPDAKVVYIDS